MTTNLPPGIAKDIGKPRPKNESEKALDRASNNEDAVIDDGKAEDIETDLARTAERNNGAAKNDLLTKTPLHGNTH